MLVPAPGLMTKVITCVGNCDVPFLLGLVTIINKEYPSPYGENAAMA